MARQRKSASASDSSMVQTAIFLPREMHERLKEVGGQRGLGEEIRKRLEASFAIDDIDKKTRNYSGLIMYLAERVDLLFGNWHKDAFSFQVFKSGANALMDYDKPSGEPVYKPDPNKLGDMLGGLDDGPEQIGRSIALSIKLNEAHPQPKGKSNG